MTQPKPTDPEPVWSRWLAEQMGGVAEHRVGGVRVDILTDSLAIEVEWIKKVYEPFAQAGLYSMLTGRDPAVLFLLRGKPTEAKYRERVRMISKRLAIPVFTWVTR